MGFDILGLFFSLLLGFVNFGSYGDVRIYSRGVWEVYNVLSTYGCSCGGCEVGNKSVAETSWGWGTLLRGPHFNQAPSHGFAHFISSTTLSLSLAT